MTESTREPNEHLAVELYRSGLSIIAVARSLGEDPVWVEEVIHRVLRSDSTESIAKRLGNMRARVASRGRRRYEESR